MRAVNTLQSNLCPVSEGRRLIFDKRSYEPLSQTFVSSLTVALSKDLLIFFQHLIECRHLPFEKFLTEDWGNLHVLFINANSSLTRENQQFAQHIPSAQIQSGIRLSIARILGPFHNFGKGAAFTTSVIAEYIIQGAGKHGFDAKDLITAVHASGNRLKDWQGSSNGSLIAEHRSVFKGG